MCSSSASVLTTTRPEDLLRGEYHIHLPPRTEAELRLLLLVSWGVRIPDERVCPHHSTPWRAFCSSFFAETPVNVWKASRNLGGKSFSLATLGLTEAVGLGADAFILGGSGLQSERVHKTMRDHWSFARAPRHLLLSDPAKKHASLSNGAEIEAQTASSTAVRSGHPQRFLVDEVDEIDLGILDDALGQPSTRANQKGQIIRSQTTLSSTHHYADGTMTEVLARAARRGYPIFEWCYKETAEPHGWMSQQRRDDLRATMAENRWETEVELQEPSPEGRAINSEAVKQMFQRDLGVYQGAPGEEIILEPPIIGATYAHGTDWALTNDWTIILTLRTDVWPWQIVAFLRCHRADAPVLAEALNDRVARYPGPAKHDATGMGLAIDGMLRYGIEGVTLTANNKYALLADYVAAIERHEIVGPWIEHMAKEHLHAAADAVFSNRKHTPDTMIAGALARAAAEEGSMVPQVY
jgi:hypothetical protein